jgi:hypothetical protein
MSGVSMIHQEKGKGEMELTHFADCAFADTQTQLGWGDGMAAIDKRYGDSKEEKEDQHARESECVCVCV